MKFDLFLISLIVAIILASVAPVEGGLAHIFEIIALGMIIFMFFAHGVKLSRQSVLSALKNWRLHIVILSITFALYPAIGFALGSSLGGVLSPGLAMGVVYLTLVPSTVQSSIAFTAASKGEVASSVASAAASNCLGVVITPILAALLLGDVNLGGAGSGGGAIVSVFGLILVPFIAGHLLRPWLGDLADRYKKIIAFNDKAAIVVIVFSSFSAAMLDRLWEHTELFSLLIILVLCTTLFLAMVLIILSLTRAMGFPVDQRRAALFCASQKSLAAGAPMAKILIAGGIVGEVLIPLLMFHQMQIFLSAAIASRLAKS